MTVFATSEAWSRAGQETWSLDVRMLESVKTPVRAKLFWSAPTSAALRVTGTPERADLVDGNALVALFSPNPRDVLLDAVSPPELSLFSPRPQPPAGFAGIGVFPRCLFAEAAAAPSRSVNSGELDRLLDEGELDAAFELFGASCLAADHDAVARAARRIAVHLAEYPLLRTEGVGLFAAALASVRSDW